MKVRSAGGAQRFLSAFSGISPHFRPRRHLMTATEYRTEMTIRSAGWGQATGAAGQLAGSCARSRNPTPPRPNAPSKAHATNNVTARGGCPEVRSAQVLSQIAQCPVAAVLHSCGQIRAEADSKCIQLTAQMRKERSGVHIANLKAVP
jgi:putative transposase